MMLPEHTSFMDSDMRELLERMQASDLKGYRLYGGTALAMYINHRRSTDFDFFKTSPVRRDDLEKIDWLEGAEFRGNEGMVDVRLSGSDRVLSLNFVDATLFSDVEPKYDPVPGTGGIPIAHPVDILASKLSALARRGAPRDFMDIAAASRVLRPQLKLAATIYIESPLTREESFLDLAKTLTRYSFEVEHGIPEADLEEVKSLSHTMAQKWQAHELGGDKDDLVQ